MWIFLNNAFVSIVEDTKNPDRLWVRARAKGDISRFFTGQVDEIVTHAADYLYRFNASRELVSLALQKHVKDLAYPNFKNSVRAHDRHYTYAGVWQEMYDFQRRRNSEEIAGYPPHLTGETFTEGQWEITPKAKPVSRPPATLSKQAKRAMKKAARKSNTRKK